MHVAPPAYEPAYSISDENDGLLDGDSLLDGADVEKQEAEVDYEEREASI